MPPAARPWITPTVAALLGLLPFVVLIGVSQRVVINGVAQESSFNIGGGIAALIGLSMAGRLAVLRDIPPVPVPVRIAAGVAALICVVGLLAVAGVVPGAR